MIKLKESSERIQEIEKHKKCYLDTITYLEGELNTAKEELEKQKELNNK